MTSHLLIRSMIAPLAQIGYVKTEVALRSVCLHRCWQETRTTSQPAMKFSGGQITCYERIIFYKARFPNSVTVIQFIMSLWHWIKLTILSDSEHHNIQCYIETLIKSMNHWVSGCAISKYAPPWVARTESVINLISCNNFKM